jgi:soluble lytic murein transglycosylase-like protein
VAEAKPKQNDLYSPWKPGMPDRRRGSRSSPEHRVARRALMRRLRKPLVGIALIGAGAPMGHAMEEARTAGEPAEPANSPDASDAPEASTTDAAQNDLEERLAKRIALTKEVGSRNLAVANAVERFSITRQMAEDIYDIARENDIDPSLAFGLVNTESTFRERAVSSVGARGLTQVMPRTAKWLKPGTNADDLFDRKTNLRLGFHYLSQLIEKYRGDVRLALLAYNRGPGTVDRELKRGADPDNGYPDKVMGA